MTRHEPFPTPAAFRSWLAKNHAKATELELTFFKRHTGKPTLTWPESVAEALCYGWIDGVRKSVDAGSYTIRFTPRKPRSTWSAVNLRLFATLDAEGRVTAAGRAAFEARSAAAKPRGYSYEQKGAVELDPARSRAFRKNAAAWGFFESQAPSWRKRVVWWVMGAKSDEVKDRRLARLVAASAAKKRLG